MNAIPLENIFSGYVAPGLYVFYPNISRVKSLATGNFLSDTAGRVRVLDSFHQRLSIRIKDIQSNYADKYGEVEKAPPAERTDDAMRIQQLEAEIKILKQQLGTFNSSETVSILDPEPGLYTAMVKGFATRSIADQYEHAFGVIAELSRQPGSSNSGSWGIVVNEDGAEPSSYFDTLPPLPMFATLESCQAAIDAVGNDRITDAFDILSGNYKST